MIGTLLDENKNPLIGANISLIGTVLGAASNIEGQFEINNIPFGQYVLSVSYLGYDETQLSFTIDKKETLNLGEIVLQPVPMKIQPIVITAGKYEQNVEDVPASLSYISRMEIENRNSVTIDKTIQYIPGVNMNGDQVNIRGSSGYSRGVGSRVMMLVDGVPFIAGDTQGINFEALAMNQIEKIEVVKGAGSALYGSSAIGGIINVITKPISNEPELGIRIYGKIYSDPHYDQWNWSDKSQYGYGYQADYSQKIGSTGVRMAFTRDQDDGYRKNDWKDRINASAKIEFELSPFDLLSISSNYMEQRRGDFLYWKNLNNALVPPDERLGEGVYSKRAYVSPNYRKVISQNTYLRLNTLWFYNHFDDNLGQTGNRSSSDFLNAELQLNTKLNRHHFTFGINPTYNKVSSNIFGSRKGSGIAVFAQDELRLNEQWIATLGARFDYYDIDKLGSDQQVSPKAGLVYKPVEGTALRASAGSGFRAPSMAETFTSTSVGGIIIQPNENLKAERSVSSELGWRQILSKQVGFDMVVFYNHYWDLIEGGFLPSGKVQFRNVTEARISGIESVVFWKVIPQKLDIKVGYTYIDNQNITLGDYLNYRPRHLLYTQVGWNFRFISVQADYRYLSKYDRIDQEFSQIVADAESRVDAHILDLRLITNITPVGIPLFLTFQINNLLQYHYIDLVGSLAPIRNYILSISTRL